MTRSRTRASIAALAALALVGAVVLTGAHRAWVRHVECAEHGEQIELEQQGTAAAPDLGITAMAASDWTLDGDDDHCGILAAANRAASAPGDAHLHDAGTALLDEPASPDAVAPAPASALYRIAPKTSPPV